MDLILFFFFKSSCRFSRKLSRKQSSYIHPPSPHPGYRIPIIDILHCYGTFLKTGEPTLIRQYLLQFTVYIRTHSLGYTFYRFQQMYSDVSPPLRCHLEQFYLINSLCSTYLNLPPSPGSLAATDLYCLQHSAFSRMLQSQNGTFRLASLTQHQAFTVSPGLSVA